MIVARQIALSQSFRNNPETKPLQPSSGDLIMKKPLSFAPASLPLAFSSLWSVILSTTKEDFESFKQRNLTALFTIITIVASLFLSIWALCSLLSEYGAWYQKIVSRGDTLFFILWWIRLNLIFIAVTYFTAMFKNKGGVGWLVFFYLTAFLFFTLTFLTESSLIFFHTISIFLGMMIGDVMKYRNQKLFPSFSD